MGYTRTEEMNKLFETILKLDNIEECYSFFEDICTIQELESLSQRLQVAKMLTEKRVYSDIVAQTGASTATISRVNRCLKYGSDGYNKALDQLEANRHPGVTDRRRS